jgi:hypothetical protein
MFRSSDQHLMMLRCLLSSCLISYLCLSGNAQAQKTKRIKQSRAFPISSEDFYDNDPWYNLKIAAEQEMGLFLVDPPRRHASEMTQYSSDHLHFHLWRPISETNQAMWSRALGWLIFGRVKYSRGAQQLFADIPTLKRITLSLHEVQRPRSDGQTGCISGSSKTSRRKRGRKRRPETSIDTVHTYVTLSLTRRDFERLKINQIKQCSKLLDCDKEVRSMVSLLKLNTRYLKRRAR